MGMLAEGINSSKRRHQRQEGSIKSFSLGLLLKSTALDFFFFSIFSFAEKDLAAVEDDSNKSQQGALTAKVVNHILGCINKTALY